ncbi:MAG: Hsp20/alpha crystallin family protein [Verrucomicrobiota bacterium]
MSLFTSLVPAFARQTPARAGSDGADVETVRPRHEIRETDDAFGLTVYLPGVARENLELTAEDGEIRVFGRRSWKQPEGWTQLHRETSDAAFELILSHEHAVNIDAIHAELSDGVLRVSLPKAEAIKPRKIAVS